MQQTKQFFLFAYNVVPAPDVRQLGSDMELTAADGVMTSTLNAFSKKDSHLMTMNRDI